VLAAAPHRENGGMFTCKIRFLPDQGVTRVIAGAPESRKFGTCKLANEGLSENPYTLTLAGGGQIVLNVHLKPRT